MRKSLVLAILTVGTILGTRPAAALPGFTLAATTPRVSFYTRGPAVDVTGVEASLTRIEGTLGTRLSGHASYYRYATAQEVAAGTGHYADGVTFAGQVHSTHGCHDHELVHLIAAQMGDPGRFFQEGLAVALGDAPRNMRKAAKKALSGGQPVLGFVSGFDGQDQTAAYAVAGTFVRHLIETQGMDKVRAFYRGSRSEAGMRGAFAAAFGQGLEPALEAWRADL
jgi:hypothetical protein